MRLYRVWENNFLLSSTVHDIITQSKKNWPKQVEIINLGNVI